MNRHTHAESNCLNIEGLMNTGTKVIRVAAYVDLSLYSTGLTTDSRDRNTHNEIYHRKML